MRIGAEVDGIGMVGPDRGGREVRVLDRWMRIGGDRVIGAPESAPIAVAHRAIRHGSPALRARAVRALRAALRMPPQWRQLVGDAAPAVRAATADAAGANPTGAGRLGFDAAEAHRLARAERDPNVRLSLCVAAARLGLGAGVARALFLSGVDPSLQSWSGARRPARALGEGPSWWESRWAAAAGGEGDVLASAEARARALEGFRRAPDDPAAQLALASQRHPDDLSLFQARVRTAGRRESHRLSTAFGVHGDPRSVPALIATLTAMDVDPGHGFAGRRAAGLALGRLGLPGAGRVLLAAVSRERRDYEGRPGAGMGIQYPVRSALLLALGGTGDRAATPCLVEHLADTDGSPLGGFYLPASLALWRLGAEGACAAAATDSDPVRAANAAGIRDALRAWGRDGPAR